MSVTPSFKREWFGPRFWRVLHTLAEKSGSITNPTLALDEQYAWIGLLTILPGCMPCMQCRQHYVEYFKRESSFRSIRSKSGDDRRKILREWLWNLHNKVNESNGKPEYTIEECISTYSSINIDSDVKEIYEMLKLGLLQKRVFPDAVEKWKKAVGRLRQLYGV